MYVSYAPEEFDGMLNVTISDVMDIVHPERKKVVNELTGNNSTTAAASNSTINDGNNANNQESNKGSNSENEQKVKSDL